MIGEDATLDTLPFAPCLLGIGGGGGFFFAFLSVTIGEGIGGFVVSFPASGWSFMNCSIKSLFRSMKSISIPC